MFKKKGQLSKNKKWRPESEEMEETNKICLLSAILGTMRKREKMRKHKRLRGKYD
jgi:hypothetical protein